MTLSFFLSTHKLMKKNLDIILFITLMMNSVFFYIIIIIIILLKRSELQMAESKVWKETPTKTA